jgi:hypothetical protein
MVGELIFGHGLLLVILTVIIEPTSSLLTLPVVQLEYSVALVMEILRQA